MSRYVWKLQEVSQIMVKWMKIPEVLQHFCMENVCCLCLYFFGTCEHLRKIFDNLMVCSWQIKTQSHTWWNLPSISFGQWDLSHHMCICIYEKIYICLIYIFPIYINTPPQSNGWEAKILEGFAQKKTWWSRKVQKWSTQVQRNWIVGRT